MPRGSPRIGYRPYFNHGRAMRCADAPANALAEGDEAAASDRILLAYLRLTAEKGLRAASIRDIVVAAGVSRPVLYYHFQSKEELHQVFLRQQAKWISDVQMSQRAAGSSCEQRIEHLFSGLLHLFDTGLLVPQTLTMASNPCVGEANRCNDNVVLEVLEEALSDILEAGVLSREVRDDARRNTLDLLVALSGVILHRARRLHSSGLGRENIRPLIRLLFEGIRPPRTIQHKKDTSDSSLQPSKKRKVRNTTRVHPTPTVQP